MTRQENSGVSLEGLFFRVGKDGLLVRVGPNEDARLARNLLETLASKPLPDDVDPVRFLEEVCQSFSERQGQLDQHLDKIQDIMIRALHPDKEDAGSDGSKSDEELLARMREDSEGFAKMVCQGFEQMKRDAGL